MIRHKGGNLSVAAAMFLTLMMVVAAFAIESSNLYVVKLQAQRTSDIANLAAARTSQPLTGTTASAAAIATASNLAALNGVKSAEVKTEGRTTGSGGSAQTALVTTISRSVPLQIGKALQAAQTVAVDGQSWAVVSGSPTGSCILSILGYTNIFGNASVKGPKCGLSSASYVFVCNKAVISLLSIAAGYPAWLEKNLICSNVPPITPPLSNFAYDAKVFDPLKDDPRILAIQQRLAAIRSAGWTHGNAAPRTVMMPSVSFGPNQVYGPLPATVAKSAQLGAMSTSPTGVILQFAGSGGPDPTCANPTTFSNQVTLSGVTRLRLASGCYVFHGNVVTSAFSSVTFETLPAAVVTLVFKSHLISEGAMLVIGDATISVAGNIDNRKGVLMTFGKGEVVVGFGILNGAGYLSFGDGPYYFIGTLVSNEAGIMKFGNGQMYFWGGQLRNASTGTMTLGNGPFLFYSAPIVNVEGKMTFGRGPYELYGSDILLYPKSETSFGVGDMQLYGGGIIFNSKSVTIGAGGSAVEGGSSIFLVGGSFWHAAGDMTAIGTTIALDYGAVWMNGNSKVKATAPTGKTPAYGYQDILVTTMNSSLELSQTVPVTNTMSGTIYVPKGVSYIHGKHTTKPAVGGCLQFFSGIITFYEDSSVELSPCTGAPSSVSSVALVR